MGWPKRRERSQKNTIKIRSYKNRPKIDDRTRIETGNRDREQKQKWKKNSDEKIILSKIKKNK